jgi:hypothetical protein
MMPSMRDALAYAIMLVASVTAVARASFAKVPRSAPTMNDGLAHQAYLELTDKEAEERRSASLRFQGAVWSQQDEFHSKEAGLVRQFATAHHVSISSVVDALDRGMREQWPTRPNVVVSQRVIPCRPRLAY